MTAAIETSRADRPLDHLVLAVRDLDAARALYTRLGFTLTPPARHPFGTANSLVQLHGSFLELLAIADHAAIRPISEGEFSFAAFNADFLARREGMSMLVFASGDARRDQAEFVAAGLHTYEPFDFQRRAGLPDGGEATVGFSLAFVTDPRLPRAGFFSCQQHAPEHFWRTEYQRHRNAARTLDEVVMVALVPGALADLFDRLQPGGVARQGEALVVTTTRGRIAVLTPSAFAARFGCAPVDETPHFAAFRIAVADLARCEAALGAAGVVMRRGAAGALQIGPQDSFGVVLEFGAG